MTQQDRRVIFDFAIAFTNGGGIQGQDFRLDIAGEEIDDRVLADYLDCGVKLVGIDSHNIDDTGGRSRPVHSTLLGAGILIVEHLTNLAALPDEGFSFTAVPPKIEGVGTFPVRAFARLA